MPRFRSRRARSGLSDSNRIIALTVFWILLLIATPLIGEPLRAVPKDAKAAHLHESYDLHIPLTDQEKAYLAALPTLRLGMDPDWPPYAFLDADGKPDGISADYLQYIVQTLHIRVERVGSTSWSDTLRLVNQGQIDVLVAMSPNIQLTVPFLATQPYIDYPVVIATRKDFQAVPDLNALNGLRVAMVKDSGVGAAPGLDTSVKFERYMVGSGEEGLQAIESGKAQAFVGNLGVIDRLIRQHHAGALAVSGATGYSQSIGFGVAQDYEPLRLLMDRVLKAIPEEEREHIQNTWLSTTLQNGISRHMLWEVLAPISIVILISLAVLSVIIMYLRKEIRLRRWNEQELTFQISFFRSLMATAPMPVFVKDMEGRYISVNPAFESMVGLKAESMVGKTASDIHPKDKASNNQLEGITAQVLSTGQSAQGELQYRSNLGDTHDVMYWLRRVNEEGKQPRAMLGVLVDVSRLRSMEREQRNLRRQLVELTQVLPALIFQVRYVSGEGFSPIFISDYAEKLLGVSQRALMTSPELWLSTLPRDTRLRLWRPLLRAQRTGQAMAQEFSLERREAPDLWVRMEAVCHENDGGVCTYTGYLSDITQLKLQRESLALAKQQAEEASRVKDTFLATMSHEIRTPMSGMIGVLDLMNRSNLQPNDQHLLDMSRGAARTLLRILNDILDFAKSQTTDLPMDRAPFDLRSVVDEVTGLFGPEMQRKGLQLEVFISTLVAASHLGDGQRLAQVLLNLVGNALKFTDSGIVGITVEALPTDTETQMQQLSIVVRDTGVGISQPDQERLFQPFMQVGSASAGGTGLGLVICRRIIEAMGGSIRLRSEPGKGTSVEMTLTFPVAAAGSPDPKDPSGQASIHLPDSHAGTPDIAVDSKATILLVEDQPLNRELLVRQLLSLGVQSVHTAANGLEAWHACEKQDYTLIITDCSMPIMDGESLIRRIRAKEAAGGERSYLVALTANAMEPQRVACMAAGADEVLIKPVDLKQLRDLMDKTCVDNNNTSATAALQFQPDTAKTHTLPEGISAEEWPKLRQRIIVDMQQAMDDLRAAMKQSQQKPAWEAVHRILGVARWFKLLDISSTSLALQTSLENGEMDASQLQSLEQAVATFTGD
jgi:two-component system, NarL family, sensor histidine kinase EvgS